MTAPHDLDRQLQAFLTDGPTELPDASFDAVRDRIEATRQRVFIGPWRFPDMSKFVPIGVGAATLVVALALGSQSLGRPAPLGGTGGAPSAEPSATPTPDPTPSPTAWAGLPEGPFVITDADVPVEVTLDIATPGWVALPEFGAVSKDDDGRDPPDTVGVALLAWAWPAGTGFNVYGDPCQWSTTVPATPATTPGEIAAAFAAQASTDATAPVDVTVGGYAGKAVTLQVPMEYHLPNSTRQERFADCDEDEFVFYGVEGEVARNAQGAGQVDELRILDVDGQIVILDATYSPATPADLVEELRTLAESATFEQGGGS